MDKSMLPHGQVTAPHIWPLDWLHAASNLASQSVWLALVLLAGAVPLAAAWLSNPPVVVVVAAAAAPFAITVVVLKHPRHATGAHLPAWACTRSAWFAAAALGAALRVAWPVLAPAVLSSDSLSYYAAALRLLGEGRLTFPFPEHAPVITLLAWRPPGYIFVLAAWFRLFGSGPAAIVALNIAIYFGNTAALAALARRVLGREAVLPALLAFALWPVGIGSVGVTLSDSLSILTYLLVLLLFEPVLRGRLWPVVPTGIVAGLGVLVRPSMLLMPVLWFALTIMPRVRFRRTLAAALLATASMALTILPWTVRNDLMLNHFVLVSTNNGSVLYRANNPLATGNYTPRGERDLDALAGDEVEWSATGSRWAREWIISHPAQFAALAVKKQAYFWGLDEAGNGPRAFSPEFAAERPTIIRAIEVLCNTWWLALLAAVFAALVAFRRLFWTDPALMQIVLAILLLAVVHAVYESHQRYHQPIVGLLILIAVIPFAPSRIVVTNRSTPRR